MTSLAAPPLALAVDKSHMKEGPAKAAETGILKTESGEYQLTFFSDSADLSQGVSEFLEAMNQQRMPPELLRSFQFLVLTQEMVEVEEILRSLAEELGVPSQVSGAQSEQAISHGGHAATQPTTPALPKESSVEKPKVYSSLFDMVRSFHKDHAPRLPAAPTRERAGEAKEDARAHEKLAVASLPERHSSETSQVGQREREKQEREKGGGGGGRNSQDEGEGQPEERNQQHPRARVFKKKRKKLSAVEELQAAASVEKEATHQEALSSQAQTPAARPMATHQKREKKTIGGSAQGGTQRPALAASSAPSEGNLAANHRGLGGVENIYIRFMALMARILGQAELEAHELYVRIKERTDNIDLLTLFLSKLNSEKGGIDWSNRAELKQLVDKARALGVDIPEGKYSWSEDEKKLLKENIQLRKDSMEKVTQLERTDMQRYLQEASQCHQARSNILKLLKEVIDTIIANMRV